MSGSLIAAVNCSGNKIETTVRNTLKKTNQTEIQASPILLLTVAYPQNSKLQDNYSKHNVQTIQIDETVQRAESIPYSVLQLGDSVIKGDASYETYEGSIEVDGSKLNSSFAPVLVIQNEGTAEIQCSDSCDSLSKATTNDHNILNNFLFSPIPKSVVCTVMRKDGSERESASIEESTICVPVTNEEINQMERFEDSYSNLSDEESVHVISDKPVTCRALASLPVNFLYFGKTSTNQCKGVFAKKEIPIKSRFGPMEGVLTSLESNFTSISDEGLHLTVENNGSYQRLDVSNENTSNWMRYVRRAETFEEQNLNLYQTGKLLYFNATRKIMPGEELKAWYSNSYAKSRNLPLLNSPTKNVIREPSHASESEEFPEKENTFPSFNNESSGSKWRCTHCQRVFKSATLFNLHVLTHAADNLETNDSCDKSLSPSFSLEASCDTNRVKKTFACSHCPKTFPSNTSLTVHLRTHSSTTILDCPICKAVFYKVPHFREHIHTHAINGIFHCPQCSKKFSVYKHIRGHMRRFHCEKNFGCMQCSKRFSTLDKLKTHLLSHSDHRQFTCAKCGKQFKRKDKLSVHVKKTCDKKRATADVKKQPANFTKYAYNCHICVLGFKRRGMLVNHLAARHPEISPDSIPELNLPIYKDNKDYYCQYCGKIYKSSTKRKLHIVKNHPGKKLPPSKLSLSSKSTNLEKNETFSQTVGSITKMPESCPWCYKQYASKAKLLQHQRKKHPNQMPKSLLHPKRSGGFSLDEERDAVREAVEKVTDPDMFLSDALELSEYELSVGEGEFIIDANTLKRAMKGDVLTSDCSPETLAELGQIIENRPDSYFKVYQGPSGITMAHPVEVWDPLSLCLSPPPSHLLPSSN